jgi:hypothetical protein
MQYMQHFYDAIDHRAKDSLARHNHRNKAIKLGLMEECKDYGAKGLAKLELHHKDGNPRNGRVSNFVCVCKRCHKLRGWDMWIKRLETDSKRHIIVPRRFQEATAEPLKN